MSSLNFDFDLDRSLENRMMSLESEWRQVYEASIIARAEYQALAADRKSNAAALDGARERLDRAEAMKAGMLAKIELLLSAESQ